MNMAFESRKQKFKRAMEQTAKVGFEQGFVEGGRYVLSLIMGLPRPSRVVVNKDLPPGTVEMHCSPEGPLQEERVGKLGDLLDAIRETDVRSAMDPKEEVSPAKRLERIAAYCSQVSAAPRSSNKLKEIMAEVMRLARGEGREG